MTLHFFLSLMRIHCTFHPVPLYPFAAGMIQIDMSTLLFIFEGVFPVFLLIVCGWLIKRKKLVGEGFFSGASKLVFKIGLPALVFLKISPLDFNQVFNIRETLLICGIILGSLLFSVLLSLKIKDSKQKGPFVQGAFRGNVAIIGIALILNLYGEEMMARGAMILAFLLPIFNVFSVIALTVPLHGLTMKGLSHSLANIVKNPIILSVATALIFSLFEIPVPMTIKRFLGYLSDLALPLALITIGGTLTYHGMMHKGTLALSASFIKLLILPLAGVTVFYKLGYRGDDLGMTFLILGAPTAVTSHVMAESMENDGELAALIVMFTTAASAVTTMIGLYLIEQLS